MADNEWMYSGHISATQRTAEWIWKTEYYLKDAHRGSKIVRPLCPCARCKLRHRQGRIEMTKHLWQRGYMPDFSMQINFDELDRDRGEVMRHRVDGNADDGIRNMLHDYAAHAHLPSPEEKLDEPKEPEPTTKAFLDMMASAKKPLYLGAKISQLDAISQMLAIKAEHCMTQSGFEGNLKTAGYMLPKGHCLPQSLYESMKIMRAFSMDYEKIPPMPRMPSKQEFLAHLTTGTPESSAHSNSFFGRASASPHELPNATPIHLGGTSPGVSASPHCSTHGESRESCGNSPML